jgi:hypothetical protein
VVQEGNPPHTSILDAAVAGSVDPCRQSSMDDAKAENAIAAAERLSVTLIGTLAPVKGISPYTTALARALS